MFCIDTAHQPEEDLISFVGDFRPTVCGRSRMKIALYPALMKLGLIAFREKDVVDYFIPLIILLLLDSIYL